MNKATLKKLIDVWVDHNNEYRKIEGYLIHKDTGIIYSNKRAGRPSLRKTLNPNKYIKLNSYLNMNGYPMHKLSSEYFSDLHESKKDISVHKLLMISNIFHFNLLDKILHKAFPHISLKALKRTTRAIKKEILRGSCINHKDHNKRNHNLNNLELVTDQGNSKKYEEHRKKSL